MSYKNRSKHYDFFSPQNKNDQTPTKSWKQKLKKFWKWLKIAIIVFVIGTGLVGCVQSFSLRSPVTIGTGFEMYGSKDKVSPQVSVLKYNNVKNTFELVNNSDFAKINPYVWKESPEELNEIRNQVDKNGGNYEQYRSQTLGFQLVNNEKQTINGVVYHKDNNYLLMAKGDKNGEGAVKSYENVNKWTNIYYPTILYKTEKVTVEDENTSGENKEITVNKNVGISNIIYNVLPDYVSQAGNLSLKFARDFYQALAEEGATQFKLTTGKEVVNKNSENKTYWDYITQNSTVSSGSDLDILNGFILNLKNLENQKLDANLISVIEKISLIKAEERQYYGNILTGFYLVTNQKDANNANVIEFSNVSTYNESVNVANAMANYYQEAHRPISTWAEFWEFGPFYGLFVWPIYKILIGLMIAMNSLGGWAFIIAIIITIIITRLITILLSYKSLFASAKQQELNSKKAKIEAKYAPYKGDKQMEQRKRAEIQEMYKKNHANPYTAMLSTLITLPILLVMFRVIQASPDIKSTFFLGLDMSATSWRNLVYGKEWGYLPVILISLVVQLFSQLLPRILNRKKDKLRTNVYEREAFKKSNRMQNIMMVVFVGFGVIFQAGLQIYWIFTGIWQICQTLAIWKIERTDFYKKKILPKL
ncbi:membrane protein insertase YidC [[Mycoplasma] gypis]|uniref:Membrane protein insertase YidC n=1 Tax=[Mycoplasma] gypis TaxID=92404 RepID=A0ABZ2RPM1_9BACT|nr:membrane protein insertase YidC [[Mycoplasma] gypis]MBN0919563.1 membrane protein insertase YidC [[Mycoplasma] gypis]